MQSISECRSRTGIIQLGNRHYIMTKQPVYKDEILAGHILFLRDLRSAGEPAEETNIVVSFMNIYKRILSAVPIPMILTDKRGRIVVINDEYAKFLGVDANEVIGEPITKVIPTSKVPVVLRTKKAETAQRFVYKDGREAIVHRIPIIENGELIGVFGMLLFKDLEELKRLANKIKVLKDEKDYYKGQLSSFHRAKYSLDNIISCSEKMAQVKKEAKRAAKSSANVLVTGESGVGKELLVHAIHLESDRVNEGNISFIIYFACFCRNRGPRWRAGCNHQSSGAPWCIK